MVKKKGKVAAKKKNSRILDSKRIIILVITVTVLLSLSLVLLFQDQFAGKAFYVGTLSTAGLQGAERIAVNSEQTYQVKANLGANKKSVAVKFELVYPAAALTLLSLPDQICALLDQKFNSGTNLGLYSRRECSVRNEAANKVISVEYAGICADSSCSNALTGDSSGNTIISEIRFRSAAAGTVPFSFRSFTVYDLNSSSTAAFSLTSLPGQIMAFECINDNDCRVGDGQVCGGDNRCVQVTCRPSAETCDGRDNDCDGQVDETFPDIVASATCNTGQGQCRRLGQMVCKADGTGTECNAIAGTPVAEICTNGFDDDCDGAIDTSDSDCPAQATCTPVAEICDGLDNDCDNIVDEALYEITTCGVGRCQGQGSRQCMNGQWRGMSGSGNESCRPANLPYDETVAARTCNDNIDNDCDGTTDAADASCSVVPVCGNNRIDGDDTCDGNSQTCRLSNGYAGTQRCNAQCSGFDSCVATERCGDGVRNGPEQCDDGTNNGLAGRCNLQCTGIVAVGCTTATQCSGNTPICFSGRCVPCTGQHQCLRDLPSAPNCITVSSDSSRQGMCVANGQVRVGETCTANVAAACGTGLSCIGGVCRTEAVSCSSSTLAACTSQGICEAVNRLIWNNGSCKNCPNLNGVLSRISAWKNRNSTLNEVLISIALWKNQRCA